MADPQARTGADARGTQEGLLARLDAVQKRLNHLVATPTPGLTEPDPATGERWEAGQAWAHIAEFVPYWLGELERVTAGRRETGMAGDSGQPEPVPFGRTKSDPGRIAAIERDRHEDPRALLRRTGDGIEHARTFMRDLPPSDWATLGRHPTRGKMDVAAILADFVVGHLEEHADQLEGLARAAEGEARSSVV